MICEVFPRVILRSCLRCVDRHFLLPHREFELEADPAPRRGLEKLVGLCGPKKAWFCRLNQASVQRLGYYIVCPKTVAALSAAGSSGWLLFGTSGSGNGGTWKT